MMSALASINPLQTFLMLLLFGGVVTLSYYVMQNFQRSSAVRRELRSIASRPLLVTTAESLQARQDGAWSRLAKMIEGSGLSLVDSKPDALRARLIAAGFIGREAPRLYTLIRLVLIFLVPMLVLGTLVLLNAKMTVLKLYLYGAGGGLIGLYLPALLLQIKVDRRTEAITNGFPNCLDLMLVCVEAGLGLEAAFDRVGRELAEAEPLVAQLLTSTVLHLRAGATREEALRRMANGSGIPEIRSFSTLLIQSDKLGTSIATTLRVYASEMRERRRMRAEEKAHRLPVLISIPLIVCMLPTMVGVLMLPAVILVIRQIIPAMTGG